MTSVPARPRRFAARSPGDLAPRGAVLAIGAFVAMAALAGPSPVAADSAPVDITAYDGLELGATLWGAAQTGPGVLLLHQCNRDRHSWEPLAQPLADAGFHVLAIDFRGFGDSRNAVVRDFHTQQEELWPLFDDDVDRALAFLQSVPDVDPDRIGVLGASCGGSQALLMALRHPEVQAVGFLSSNAPWISGTDLDAFESAGGISFLGIGAEGDQASAELAQRLFDSSSSRKSRLILYKGALHGVPLFEQDENLVEAIVSWFGSAL